MAEERKPFHEVVAERLIEQLKAGTAPWQKPWEPGQPGAFMPMNPTTGKRYKGINAIHLMAQGRGDSRWLTYKQAEAVGAQVKRGERGTPVQYWKFADEQDARDAQGKPVLDAKGEPVKEKVMLERPRVFFATVFNAEQIEGLPPLQKKEQTWDAQERAEAILAASGADIRHGAGDRAFYRPASDSIHLPEKGQFPSADRYYATALHELGHWTGHESRLNRDLVHPFGSEGYAKEELRAEIASMILGDELGIGHDPGQHAAYVGSWVKALEDDPLEIFRAAAEAEKIHGYVLAFEQKLTQEQEKVQGAAPPDFDAVKYLVCNENTLCYREQGTTMLGVLSGNVDGLDWKNGPFLPGSLDALRPATAEDFQRFRVVVPPDFVQQHETKNLESILPNTEVIDMDKLPDWTVTHTGTLADKLEQAGLLTRVDAVLASALRDMKTGTEATREVDLDALTRASVAAVGAAIPAEFTGQVLVLGVARVDGVVTRADEANVPATAYQVFARDGAAQPGGDAFAYVGEYRTEDAAQLVADRLALVDAYAQVNADDRSAKLAWIEEDRIRRDPASTDADRMAAKEGRKTLEFTAGRREDQKERVMLAVPFREKEQAKSLGAKWDRQAQSWFVPPGVDPSPFQKWAAGPVSEPVERSDSVSQGVAASVGLAASQGRIYLAVPYGERDVAKAAGAAWDKVAKSWYAGPKADMEKLQRWAPENVPSQQGPAMSPQEEFSEALRSLGCVVEGKHPMMDGKTHRIPVEGDKKGEAAGFYVGHLDGHPAGYIKNNKTNLDMKWKSKGYALDPEEKAKLVAEAATKLAERAAEQARQQEAAAQRIAGQIAGLSPVEAPTAYMLAKGIEPQYGALTDKDGQKTYIPATDVSGKVWTMQYIQEDGTKRFAKESKKEGCFHVVGGSDALAAARVLVIAEGYATASTLAGALGQATVAAFDSGNLAHVARALHEKYPEKPVLIAGDDDKHLELTQGSNPGRTKAEEAARAVGGKAIFPVFAAGECTWPAEVPKVTPQAFRAHVAASERLQAAEENPAVSLTTQETNALKSAILSPQQVDALRSMKSRTDFNDVATKSALGIEGVERQARAHWIAAMGWRGGDAERQQERTQTAKQARESQDERPRRSVKI